MRRLAWLPLLVLLSAPAPAVGESAGSRELAAQAGWLDADDRHSCARLGSGAVRCWGLGTLGRLGYGNTATIGDNETPAAAGTVDLGAGRTARSIAAGVTHTCALLDSSVVRCWGDGANGRLGTANTETVGDDETAGSVAPVDLGAGRTATAVTAGGGHNCAVLDTGAVRCWGEGDSGRPGYANTSDVGDDEAPGSVGPVDLGVGRAARAVTAGLFHTCALLDTDAVRCWGFSGNGQLGYGNTTTIGDTETPGSVGPVDLGPGRTARAITAGGFHTCALLDDGSVRCWGVNGLGQLGYGNTDSIGDTETPGSVGPVALGAGRTAVAITAGIAHTCALLDNGAVRCWGIGNDGRLGYANTDNVGDTETPDSVGPVDLGAGRTARAITAGGGHTCALLDTGALRCWGIGGEGRRGSANTTSVGDTETPGSVAPADLGGSVSPFASDLSVALGQSQSTGAVGDQRTLTVTVTNGGSDSATGAQVAVRLPAGLRLLTATPSSGTFDAASRAWQPAPVVVGAPATLTLTVQLVERGDQRTEVELLEVGQPDPDSTPGNGPTIPIEDDLATASLAVSSPVTGAKGDPGGGGGLGAGGAGGAKGAVGGKGGGGAPGGSGATGPQGAVGIAGAAGRDAWVTCKAGKRKRGRVVVTCRVTPVGRATARLLLRGRVLATGRVTAGRLTLRPRRALRRGTYVLRLVTRLPSGRRVHHDSRIRIG